MTTRVPSRPTSVRLEASLSAWLDAGVIGPDQAAAIRRFEAAATGATQHERQLAAAPTVRRVPLIAEALGYLGGMLGVLGVAPLTAKYWPTLGATGRLTVTVAMLAVLTLAGAMVPHRGEAALERLRSFVWAAATASGALAGGVFAKDVLGADWVPSMVLAAAMVATVHSLVLWWHHDRPVQQATLLVGLLVVMGTATAEVSDAGPAGLAVWATAAALVVAGLLRDTVRSTLTLGIGALGTIVGAAITIESDRGSGLAFTVLTAGALLLVGGTTVTSDASDRMVLGLVGLAGTVVAGPQTVMWFGQDAAFATGATVFAVGVALVLGARHPAVTTPLTATLAGGALLVVGPAVTGIASVAVATVTGLAVAVSLLAVGASPRHAVMTVFGCAGLLGNVPWAISHFFPGEGRAPLLVAVSGVLIVLVAIWLAHQGGELRHQFRRHTT